jgi:hypothetical protein
MKVQRTIIAIIFLALPLAGCKQEITATVYIKDIAEAVLSQESMITEAIIELEMPTDKACNEKMSTVTRIISPFFINVKKVQCIEKGSDAFFYARFEVPLMKVVEDRMDDDHFGGISFQLRENNNGIEIFLRMKGDKLSALNNDLSNEFLGSGGITSETLKVAITINNDDRVPYNLRVNGVFIDGRPVVYGPHTLELKRRSESVVTLSNVSVAALVKNSINFVSNSTYIARITPLQSLDERSGERRVTNIPEVVPRIWH